MVVLHKRQLLKFRAGEKDTGFSAKDPRLVPRTHFRRLLAACNSNSRGFDALFWPLWAPVCMCHTYKPVGTRALKNKNLNI